jgi:hypothetical protein
MTTEREKYQIAKVSEKRMNQMRMNEMKQITITSTILTITHIRLRKKNLEIYRNCFFQVYIDFQFRKERNCFLIIFFFRSLFETFSFLILEVYFRLF